VEYCDKFAKFLKLLGDYHQSSCDNLGQFVKDYNEMKMKFYAVTHLPYSETDSQQCMRKARIGNCVVSVVFQSEEATFSPEIITSQFLHVYVVIQPLSSNSDEYKITIVSKNGVPDFGPNMEFSETINEETFEKFLLKLVNAEQAAYKTGKLAILRKNYRLAGLNHIVQKYEENQTSSEESGRWRVCNVL